MTDRTDNATGEELEVAFTEQQLVLLGRVLEEGSLGNSMEEVCLRIFREYSGQLFGSGGRTGS